MAGLLGALSVAFLAAAVFWQPAPDSLWQPVLHTLTVQAWPILAVASLLLVYYRRAGRRKLADELLRLSGPQIVAALPPRQVLNRVLSATYGPNVANADVVSAILGGEGVRPGGADLTTSTHTTVDYELRAIDWDIYELVSTVRYSFKENVADHRFVIFATCDPDLRDAMVLGCRFPLFETWNVLDRTLFDKSVDEMLTSVRIGISYTDTRGERHEAESSRVELRDVSITNWPEFLTFFREPMGNMPKRSPRDYLDTLRIFECDLREISGVAETISSVQSLSLRSMTLQSVQDNYCFWQAPYPCYVDRVTFDAKGLAVDGETPRSFRMVPFSIRSGMAPGAWTPADELGDLFVRSWMLPGHGVALLWKPSA